MAYSKTEQTVYDMLAPIVEPLGLSVWDVEYKKEGRQYFLRVFIDREGGVSIDDCERVSRALEEKLDAADPIPNEYCLEVSSAGLDRLLKRPSDFVQFLGHKVDVKTYAPVEGQKEFTAVLEGYEDGVLTLTLDGRMVELAQDKTSSVRLTVEF